MEESSLILLAVTVSWNGWPLALSLLTTRPYSMNDPLNLHLGFLPCTAPSQECLSWRASWSHKPEMTPNHLNRVLTFPWLPAQLVTLWLCVISYQHGMSTHPCSTQRDSNWLDLQSFTKFKVQNSKVQCNSKSSMWWLAGRLPANFLAQETSSMQKARGLRRLTVRRQALTTEDPFLTGAMSCLQGPCQILVELQLYNNYI